MVRFLICDVDTAFCAKLGSALHKLYDPCRVEYLYGPDALEVSLRCDSGGADILITEIELRQRNSIHIIREHLRESYPLRVIYITTKIEFCTEVYETRHSGFMVKPVHARELKRTVDRCIEELKHMQSTNIAVRRGTSIYMISPLSLLYAENHGRILTLVTDTERIDTYEKIAPFTYQLDRRFCQCHKSYIINMDHVRRFYGDHFLMDDGADIPISQGKRKEVRIQFLEYMRKAP